jgi:hypothetical protein
MKKAPVFGANVLTINVWAQLGTIQRPLDYESSLARYVKYVKKS